MDVHNRLIYPRSAVLLVVLLLHGSLILVFLREKPAYRNRIPPEAPTTIFFIDPQPPLTLAPPDASRITHRPTRGLQRRLRSDAASASPDTPSASPDAAISSPDTTPRSENQGSAASPPVDWSAEAHRSASEIASRGQPGQAVESPSSAPAAPWDLRPLLESTGHGMKLRIPVEIPGDVIDHCFGKMDLGHEQTGQWERYQLGCAFGKQPARGDLFDSLRKPPAPSK